MRFCNNCGSEVASGVRFCGSCGKETTRNTSANERELSYEGANRDTNHNNSYQDVYNPNQSNSYTVGNTEYLSEYYEEEFSKIESSRETYTGKFNWAAFVFGGIWALSKGLWVSAVLSFIVSMMSGGVLGFVYWFIFGFRGNYMYYNKVVKNKQTIF